MLVKFKPFNINSFGAPHNLVPVTEHFWSEHSIKAKELVYVDDQFDELYLYEKVCDEIAIRTKSNIVHDEMDFRIDSFDEPWPIVKVETPDQIMFVLPKEKAIEL